MAKTLVKVFLDSNVILSGLLSDKGAPRIILDVLSLHLPQLKGMTGEYNLREIERNLVNKLPALFPVYKKYLPKLNLKIIPLPPLKEIKNFSGQIADKDTPVLASAIIAQADFLVTGDKKDFGKLKTEDKLPLKILSPSEFLNRIISQIIPKV